MKKIIPILIVVLMHSTTTPASLLRRMCVQRQRHTSVASRRLIATATPALAKVAATHQPRIIQRIAAKAVITDRDGDILLLREARTYREGTNIGKYLLPGGRINPGEPILKGLKREVFEETGLKIKTAQPFHVGEWSPIIHGIPHQIVGMFYTCKVSPDDITLSTEHDDYAWVKPVLIDKYTLTDSDRAALNSYLVNF